jgi:hypothetical protein
MIANLLFGALAIAFGAFAYVSDSRHIARLKKGQTND